MVKYGWTCNKCGFTVHSDDKELVKKVRKGHRVTYHVPINEKHPDITVPFVKCNEADLEPVTGDLRTDLSAGTARASFGGKVTKPSQASKWQPQYIPVIKPRHLV